MVFEWAQWFRDQRRKSLTRIRSTPSSPNLPKTSSTGVLLPVDSKFSLQTFRDTFQHALGYGSWWSVALIFVLVVLGGIGWMNAWLVDRITHLLRRFGILPPLLETGLEGGPDLVDTLLRAASDGDVKTLLKLIAAFGGNKAILEAPSQTNELGDTVIHMAARFGHSNIVIALLNAGVSVEVRNSIGETPLAVAAESGHTAVVAVLLSRGADEEACVTETGLKPLHLAVMFDHLNVVRLLISRKPASLNWQEGIRLNSPLHIAVGLQHPEMVRFLLGQPGIDVTLKDADGKTAFQLAVDNAEIQALFNEHALTSVHSNGRKK